MAQLPTVHLFPPTTCSRRVLMCLAELGCKEGSEFAINLVSTTGPNKSAAHMRLQPFGKIPAWQEGDWVLYASQHGRSLAPGNSRAQCPLLLSCSAALAIRLGAAQPQPCTGLGCSRLPRDQAADAAASSPRRSLSPSASTSVLASRVRPPISSYRRPGGRVLRCSSRPAFLPRGGRRAEPALRDSA